MSQLTSEPTLWDDEVESLRELSVVDRIVALVRDSPDESLVEVAEVELTPSEVFYWLRQLVASTHLSSPGSTARAPGCRRTTEKTD